MHFPVTFKTNVALQCRLAIKTCIWPQNLSEISTVQPHFFCRYQEDIETSYFPLYFDIRNIDCIRTVTSNVSARRLLAAAIMMPERWLQDCRAKITFELPDSSGGAPFQNPRNPASTRFPTILKRCSSLEKKIVNADKDFFEKKGRWQIVVQWDQGRIQNPNRAQDLSPPCAPPPFFKQHNPHFVVFQSIEASVCHGFVLLCACCFCCIDPRGGGEGMLLCFN